MNYTRKPSLILSLNTHKHERQNTGENTKQEIERRGRKQ